MTTIAPSLAVLVSLAVCARAFAAPGHLDPPFNAPPYGFNDQVYALAVDTDDSILVGGSFYLSAGTAQPLIARLHADGTPDPDFHSLFPALTTGPVTSIAITSDHHIFVAGQLNTVNGNPMQAVTRLDRTGNVDLAFHASGQLPFFPTKVAVDPAGRVYLGAFENGFSGVFRLLPDGTRDASFNSAVGSGVYGIAPFASGALVAGIGGIVRLTDGGAVDPVFSASPDGPIYAFDRLADGRVFIAGPFAFVSGQIRPGIARLLASGSPDPAFAPKIPVGEPFNQMIALSNGGAIVSGDFTHIGADDRPGVARYAPDGTLDQQFNPGAGPDNHIRAIARQSDGRIVVGGAFSSWAGLPRAGLARLTSDTSPDPGFIEFIESAVSAREGKPPLSVKLRRFSGIDGEVSVFVDEFVSPGQDVPATNGVDHVFTPQRVTFASGQAVASVTITVVNDDLIGPTKGFGLRISDPQGGVALGTRLTCQVTRLDDDFGVSMQLAATSVSELAPGVTVPLVRVGDSGDPFTVDIETTPVTAQPGVDYEPVRTRVEFAIDTYFASVTIPVHDNDLPDGPRTFKVRIVNPLGTPNLVEPLETLVTIRDNERPGGLDSSYQKSPGSLFFIAADFAGDGSAIVLTNRFFGALRPMRILPDGNVDLDFNPGTTQLLNYIAAYDDGRFVSISGGGGGSSSVVVRLLPDGKQDPGFAKDVHLAVSTPALFPQKDGSLYVASGSVSQGTVHKAVLAHLLPDGNLDPAFNPAITGGFVKALVTDSQGRVYIGGSFGSVGGQSHRALARLNVDGSADHGFLGPATALPVGQGEVRSLVLAPDGSLYLGGTFKTLGSLSRLALARVTPGGEPDSSFGLDGAGFAGSTTSVDHLALQSDGRLIVAGSFTSYQSTALAASLVRLRTDGALDPEFDTGLVGNLNAFLPGVVQAMRIVNNDKSLMIAGHFGYVDGVNWPVLARLYLVTPVVETSAPQFDRVSVDDTGAVHLFLKKGVTGRYSLDSSDDLVTWNPGDVRNLTAAELEFVDTPAPEVAARFYVLRKH